MALAEIDPGLVVVGPSREGQEPEGAERHRQDQGVARPGLGMGERVLQRLPRPALDRQRHHRDVAALALGPGPRHPLGGGRDAGPRRSRLAAHRVQAGPGGMRQGEAGIGRDRRVERLGGARPGGEHQVDALAVLRGGGVGGGRERQEAAVVMGHDGGLER